MKDKRVVCRYYPGWAFRQEEDWLGRMSEEGFELKKVFPFLYFFRREQPGGHRYRIELTEYGKNSLPGRQYRYYLRDVGIEEACRFGRLVYLRIPAGEDWPDRQTDTGRLFRYIRRWFWSELILAVLFLASAVAGLWYGERGWDYLVIGLQFIVSCIGFRGCWQMAKWRRELEKGGGTDEG